MANPVHTMDDICGIVDDDDEEKDGGTVWFDERRCKGCPDYKKCRRRYRIFKVEFAIECVLARIAFGLLRVHFVPVQPFVDAYRKRHGGTQCRFCHHYVVDEGKFCTVCGRNMETGKRLHE